MWLQIRQTYIAQFYLKLISNSVQRVFVFLFLTMCTFNVISSRKHACELDTGVSRSRLGLIEMLMRGRWCQQTLHAVESRVTSGVLPLLCSNQSYVQELWGGHFALPRNSSEICTQLCETSTATTPGRDRNASVWVFAPMRLCLTRECFLTTENRNQPHICRYKRPRTSERTSRASYRTNITTFKWVFLWRQMWAETFEVILKPCLFTGWSLKFLQYLRLHVCLSDYNRFKTMAILWDNNRWKCSCQEVWAQLTRRWATWEMRVKEEEAAGKWKHFLAHLLSRLWCFTFHSFSLYFCSLSALLSALCFALFSSPSLFNLLIWTGQGAMYSQDGGGALPAFNQ